MRRLRRRGDAAGIYLLLALIAGAFLPVALDEVGPRAAAAIHDAGARRAALAAARRFPCGAEILAGEEGAAWGEGPARPDLEREAQASTGAADQPPSWLPRQVPLGAFVRGRARAADLRPQPGGHSPRAPPARA